MEEGVESEEQQCGRYLESQGQCQECLVWNCSVEHLSPWTIKFPDKILQVLSRCIWNNHNHFPISFPRVQLVPDRIGLDMVSEEHGSVYEHLATGAHQTGVSEGAVSLELLQVPGSQTLKI